jgi:hypothetical protein
MGSWPSSPEKSREKCTHLPKPPTAPTAPTRRDAGLSLGLPPHSVKATEGRRAVLYRSFHCSLRRLFRILPQAEWRLPGVAAVYSDSGRLHSSSVLRPMDRVKAKGIASM